MALLEARGVDVFEIERGGDVTYHGPGQVVVYPIRRLDRFREVVPLVNSLETAVTGALYRFGIEAQPRSEHRGVYVGDDAICAIGIAVKRMTSLHGLALNACTPLDYDHLITPCGTPQFGITSISAQSGREVSWAEARDALLESLEGAFGVEFERETPRGKRAAGLARRLASLRSRACVPCVERGRPYHERRRRRAVRRADRISFRRRGERRRAVFNGRDRASSGSTASARWVWPSTAAGWRDRYCAPSRNEVDLAEVAIYDERGVQRYLRLDQTGGSARRRLGRRDLIVVSAWNNTVRWFSPAGRVVREIRLPGPHDSWHVNCVTRRGERWYATVFGDLGSFRGHSPPARGAGRIVDLTTGATVVDGLTSPHAPRWVDGLWLVCNSEAQELLAIDEPSGRIVRRVPCGDWTRGIAYDDDYFYVGACQRRATEESFGESHIVVIDRRSWEPVDRIAVPAQELYDLAFVPARCWPGCNAASTSIPCGRRSSGSIAC